MEKVIWKLYADNRQGEGSFNQAKRSSQSAAQEQQNNLKLAKMLFKSGSEQRKTKSTFSQSVPAIGEFSLLSLLFLCFSFAFCLLPNVGFTDQITLPLKVSHVTRPLFFTKKTRL